MNAFIDEVKFPSAMTLNDFTDTFSSQLYMEM